MGEERREVGGGVYRLRRIPRSVSLFLSFLTNREKTIYLYIACLSLSLPPFSTKTLLYIRTLPRGSTQAETRNRFLRCANRRWLKIKAPRILSSSLLYSPFVIFYLLVRYTGKNLPGRSFDRYTRARTKIYRTFDHDWSNLARSINNHIHHLSSLFVDISRWRTRNITSSITARFSFSYSGYFYVSSVKRHFHVDIPSSNYSRSQDFFNCVYKYTRYEKTNNSLG